MAGEHILRAFSGLFGQGGLFCRLQQALGYKPVPAIFDGAEVAFKCRPGLFTAACGI